MAINQPVSQTGTLTSGTGASMAVDGDRFTCSVATSSTMEPIWTVGFADMTLIVGVVIMVPGNVLTHICLMECPTLIYWTNQLRI